MVNPEKLVTQGTKDEENETKTKYVLDTIIRKQTQITQIRQTTGGKDERASHLGTQNSERKDT